MPTIRYLRDVEGANKMADDGYCWVDAYLWQWGVKDYIKRGLKKHPSLKTTNFCPTMEDVSKQKQCGYCGRCPRTLEETTNE